MLTNWRVVGLSVQSITMSNLELTRCEDDEVAGPNSEGENAWTQGWIWTSELSLCSAVPLVAGAIAGSHSAHSMRLRAALVAFGIPILDSLWRTCRCKLDSSTVSWSYRVISPIAYRPVSLSPDCTPQDGPTYPCCGQVREYRTSQSTSPHDEDVRLLQFELAFARLFVSG